GNRVRITAELINTRNGFHLWTETYDRELAGVFALQDEITRSIVDALRVKLTGSLPVEQQRNIEVYDLYLQGLYFSNKASDEDLKRALQLDPNSASAHLFSGLHPLFHGELKDGLRLILEAKSLDPVSPIMSYVATAAYLANNRIDDAVIEGQRTLQLDPNYFYLDSVLAAAYREKGNFPEAIALYTKAQEATHVPSSGLAITYTRMGRQPEARN